MIHILNWIEYKFCLLIVSIRRVFIKDFLLTWWLNKISNFNRLLIYWWCFLWKYISIEIKPILFCHIANYICIKCLCIENSAVFFSLLLSICLIKIMILFSTLPLEMIRLAFKLTNNVFSYQRNKFALFDRK